MHSKPIASSQNPRVKFLRSLRLRKYRRREGCFLIEGIRIVGEALACGAPVETLVYAPDLLVSERAKLLAQEVEASRRLPVTGQVFRSLSNREDPQGLAAVVRIEDQQLNGIVMSKSALVLIAYQLRDPGNLGSIIRTADAAGATGLVIVEPSVDLYDPQAVRASMGSLFALPIVRVPDEGALVPWLAQVRGTGLDLLVAASSAHGDRDHFEVDYCQPTVLLVGSERHGLPTSICEASDILIRLPMVGRATSLNVSAATAVLVYEVVRQRLADCA